MVKGYKLETWKKVRWRNTLRQETVTQDRLVKRYPKGTQIDGKNVGGQFVKGEPVLAVRQKSYGTGQYLVGIDKQGRIKARHKTGERNAEWYEAKKTAIKGRKIYRVSVVLNDVPFRGNVYYGFRIVAFHHNAKLLEQILKTKLKEKLISFIEKCLGYREDEFWFDMYFGYEKPTLINGTSNTDNGMYYLFWTKRTGGELKRESGRLDRL